MPYIGNELATQFQAFVTQTITGDGSTGYTLDRAVANGKELLVYINNVKQEEGSGKSYTASGTTITFSEAVTSGDSCYLVYLGSAVQTVVPPDASIVSSMFANSALTLPNTLDVDAGITVDNITIDGQEIDVSSGDLTLDVAGNIILDADSTDILLKDGGTTYGQFFKDGDNFKIVAGIQDGDIVFRGNDGGSGIDVLTIDMSTGGRVGVTHGGTSGGPVYPFHVQTDNVGFASAFWNDGNDSNRQGIIIQCGKDDASGTNTSITFADGNGDEQGKITFSSGTVSYGAFTAYHQCIVPNADNDADSQAMAYPYGTLLETTSIAYTQKNGADTERGILYNVQKTQSANSKKVLGAYGSSMNDSSSDITNMHQVLILGDGHILCNNAGGDISVGDGICSSSTAGIGQKATANPSMIIGIAQEDVTFSGSENKLVAVQYGLQQFIPWS